MSTPQSKWSKIRLCWHHISIHLPLWHNKFKTDQSSPRFPHPLQTHQNGANFIKYNWWWANLLPDWFSKKADRQVRFLLKKHLHVVNANGALIVILFLIRAVNFIWLASKRTSSRVMCLFASVSWAWRTHRQQCSLHILESWKLLLNPMMRTGSVS